ncbi:MFS transporter, partial [Streptomyces sp. NPDC079189]
VGYTLSVVVWSVGEACVSGIASAIVANLAPAHARGRYQGAFQWTWGVSRFAALTLGVALYTGIGPAVLWWTALLGGVLCSLAPLALAERITRRMEHELAA